MKNRTKKIIALLVIISTFFALSVTAFAFDNAKIVEYGAVYYDSITNDAKEDYYNFSLTSYSKVLIGITTTIRPYTLTIYNEKREEVWKKEIKSKVFESVTYDSVIFEKELDAGNYFLKVSSKKTGDYNLKLTYKLATKPTPQENPNNHTLETATPVVFAATPTVIKARLVDDGEEDFYKIDLANPGKLDLKVLSKMTYYTAYLLNAKGDRIWYDDVNECITKKQREDNYSFELSAGTYYLKINGYRTTAKNLVAIGEYELTFTFAGVEVNETEPNDSLVEAKPISLNKTYKGHLSLTDKRDYFEFDAKAGDLAIGFISNKASYNIYIYDEYYNEKWSSKNNVLGKDSTSRSDLHKVTLEEGKYYVRVNGTAGAYSFKLSQNLDVAEISELTYVRGVTNVKLYWESEGKAHGYAIFQYDATKKNYVEIGKTSKTYYKAKKLTGGTEYKFMIKPYKQVNGCRIYGDPLETEITTKPYKVVLSSATADTKLIELAWEKVASADGYRIYYSTDRDFETVKKVDIEDGKEVSAVIEKLKSGKKYYFRVRAFKNVDGKALFGKYSNTKSATAK